MLLLGTFYSSSKHMFLRPVMDDLVALFRDGES